MALAALVGGPGPGLAATAAAALALDLLFEQPRFALDWPTAGRAARIGVFLLVALLVGYLVARLAAAAGRAEAEAGVVPDELVDAAGTRSGRTQWPSTAGTTGRGGRSGCAAA